MTIAERAEIFASHNSQDYGNFTDYSPLEEGYIQGATDQLKIDIDKACKAYCNVCYNRQTGCEKLCNDLKVFRKAMEE